MNKNEFYCNNCEEVFVPKSDLDTVVCPNCESGDCEKTEPKEFKCTLCETVYVDKDFSMDEEYISHCPKCNSIQVITTD